MKFNKKIRFLFMLILEKYKSKEYNENINGRYD